VWTAFPEDENARTHPFRIGKRCHPDFGIRDYYCMNDFQYTVVRSSRKTVSICVETDDRVIVRAPLRLGGDRIERIVSEKSLWILNRISHNRELASKRKLREYVDGEEFPFLGRKYPLERVRGLRGIALMNDRFCVGIPRAGDEEPERTAARILRWYRTHALGIIAERVQAYSERVGAEPRAVKIKTHRRRWGSCSGKGNLNFNWALVLAPIEIIDYVVVHELCHIVHHDHSTRFWSLVETILPEYRDRRKWLSVWGGTLSLEYCMTGE
jgi:predicted metal-dependent hydrolase